MAGAEGLEPSARGFGAPDRGCYSLLPVAFCDYLPINAECVLLYITEQNRVLLE